MNVIEALHRCKTDWRLLGPILVAAAAGMIFGWYYYWQVGQFNPASHRFVDYYWWPLVSDSPNAVALWVAAVLAHKIWNKRWWLLDALAFSLNIYVGMWTTLVFLLYPETMHTFDWQGALAGETTNPILFISHMGMPLLALVLLKDMLRDDIPWPAIIALVAFLAIFVGVDYWGPHLHPAPFLHETLHSDPELHRWSPWLMVITVSAWLAVVATSSTSRN